METFEQPICELLRARALELPETSEGASCVNRAFKARKKNFLFVGEKPDQVRVMVKLGPSLEAAKALADPRVEIGGTGWVTIRFAPAEPLDAELLSSWLIESYRLLAPKTLVKQLKAPTPTG